MNLNITICDDSSSDVQNIRNFLNTFQVQYDIDFTIKEYTDSQKLIREYSKSTKCDIMLLDVEMPILSGLDVAKYIRSIPNNNVIIIFISSYPEYMQNSFDVQTFHYLTKPVEYKRFDTVLKSAVNKIANSITNKIIVLHSGQKVFVSANDIIYMESIKGLSHRINMHCVSDTLQIQGTIIEWQEKLNNLAFISPGRGFLVSINHIRTCDDHTLIMSDGSSIPISRRKEQEIKSRFSKHIITLQHH